MDIIKDGEIVLSGAVGDSFFDEGFTYTDVVEALATLGRNTDVTVRLNSGGGFASDGIAIFNAFDSHKGHVTMIVESIAASAASVIAMAGDEVIMRSGAMMMVHDPAAFTMGNSEDHAKSLEMLETMAVSMADIYAEKTGRSAADIREEMKAETWMTAKDAIAKGYADKSDKARSSEPTAFDYRMYSRAPEKMVALSKSRGWKHPGATAEFSVAQTPSTNGDDPMTEAEKAAADKAAALKIEADAKAAADKAAADAKTTSDAVAAAVKAEQDRAASIHSLCQIAGKPDKAVAFITENKSVNEVIATLQAERVADAGAEVNARGGKPPAASAVSLDKHVDRVNARFDSTHTRAAS